MFFPLRRGDKGLDSPLLRLVRGGVSLNSTLNRDGTESKSGFSCLSASLIRVLLYRNSFGFSTLLRRNKTVLDLASKGRWLRGRRPSWDERTLPNVLNNTIHQHSYTIIDEKKRRKIQQIQLRQRWTKLSTATQEPSSLSKLWRDKATFQSLGDNKAFAIDSQVTNRSKCRLATIQRM